MKHSWKITLVLIGMFLLAQLIGILVIHIYSPATVTVVTNGTALNSTVYNYPYGMNPPGDTTPQNNLYSIIIAIILSVVIMLVLMKYRVELLLRSWFFVVVVLALGITLNAFLFQVPYSSLIALIIALPLAFYKIFKRNILVHNATELLIYPGIAAIFVPLLSIVTVIILLILISLYDIYAVWHAGFMQKMAKYQIQKLKLFSGFFIPYVPRAQLKSLKKSKSKYKRVKVNIAILGGGDVVFPIIVAGVVLMVYGLLAAFVIALGATLALAGLFYLSEKGKFYPAMPFISAGCFVALIIVYFLF